MTILDLVTILIAGAGLFVVLTKYYVPPLKFTILKENLFLIKRDIINNTMTRLFTGLAYIGISIRAVSMIYGFNLKKRIYNTEFYMRFFVTGFTATAFIVFCLFCFGKFISRKKFLPVLAEAYKENFQQAIVIIENDGWREDQLLLREKTLDHRKIKSENYFQAKKVINIIEDLIDLPNGSGDLKARAEKLKEYFK